MEIKSFYEEVDLSAMAKLSLENYGEDNAISDVGFLKWQYLENPAGKAYVMTAYSDDGRLVGEFAQIPLRFNLNGQTALAGNFVNTLINKSDRDAALFYKLHKEAFDRCGELAFCFSMPNPNSQPLFLKLLKCKLATHIPLIMLPMRPRALARKMVNKTLGLFVPGFVYKGFASGGKNVTVSEFNIDKDGALIDEFWGKIKNKYKVFGVRDLELFKWRYFKNPIREYKVFLVFDKDGMAGYSVVRVLDVQGVKNGMIVDFVVQDGAAEPAKALLKKSISYFAAEKCELCGCLMLSHTEEYKYIKKAGFIRCPDRFLPQPFPLTVKITDASYEDLVMNAENWFVTMGDYDVV